MANTKKRAKKAATNTRAQVAPKRPKNKKITEMDLKSHSVERYPIDIANAAKFNPPHRTKESARRTLMKKIMEVGIMKEIHVLHMPPEYDNVVVDGHRRLECAKELFAKTVSSPHPSFRTIRARIYTGPPSLTPERLYGILNGRSTMNQKGEHWLYTYMTSDHPEDLDIPRATLTQIKRTLEIFGVSWVRTHMLPKGLGPSISMLVDRTMVFLGSYSLGKKFTAKEVGEWILRFNLQSDLKIALRPTGNPSARARAICSAISANKAYRIIGT